MIRIEDNCVGCPTEMGCLGSSCPYQNVESIVCDTCGNYAEYNIDGEDYCIDCVMEYVMDIFKELSIREQLELLDIDYSIVD